MRWAELNCYKYRTLERALESLENGSLYFAAPATLNDMLEAKFDDAEPIEFIETVESTLNSIAAERGCDPIKFDEIYIKEFSAVNLQENERFRSHIDGMGIFSAASRPSHQAMWAYYADDARGVCFELELNESIMRQHQLCAKEVEYYDKPRVLNRADFWKSLLFELVRKEPSLCLEELKERSLRRDFRARCGIAMQVAAASVKHTDWRHEDEMRILAPKAGAKPILRETLRRVHFVGTKDPRWGELVIKLATCYPGVELMQWNFHHGAFSARGIPMEFRLLPIV